MIGDTYRPTFKKKGYVLILILNRLFLKRHVNHLGDRSQVQYVLKHMLNLMDKNWVSLRTPMIKTGQIRRCQGFDNFGRHVVVMRIPNNVFFN